MDPHDDGSDDRDAAMERAYSDLPECSVIDCREPVAHPYSVGPRSGLCLRCAADTALDAFDRIGYHPPPTLQEMREAAEVLESVAGVLRNRYASMSKKVAARMAAAGRIADDLARAVEIVAVKP